MSNQSSPNSFSASFSPSALASPQLQNEPSLLNSSAFSATSTRKVPELAPGMSRVEEIKEEKEENEEIKDDKEDENDENYQEKKHISTYKLNSSSLVEPLNSSAFSEPVNRIPELAPGMSRIEEQEQENEKVTLKGSAVTTINKSVVENEPSLLDSSAFSTSSVRKVPELAPGMSRVEEKQDETIDIVNIVHVIVSPPPSQNSIIAPKPANNEATSKNKDKNKNKNKNKYGTMSKSVTSSPFSPEATNCLRVAMASHWFVNHNTQPTNNNSNNHSIDFSVEGPQATPNKTSNTGKMITSMCSESSSLLSSVATSSAALSGPAAPPPEKLTPTPTQSELLLDVLNSSAPAGGCGKGYLQTQAQTKYQAQAQSSAETPILSRSMQNLTTSSSSKSKSKNNNLKQIKALWSRASAGVKWTHGFVEFHVEAGELNPKIHDRLRNAIDSCAKGLNAKYHFVSLTPHNVNDNRNVNVNVNAAYKAESQSESQTAALAGSLGNSNRQKAAAITFKNSCLHRTRGRYKNKMINQSNEDLLKVRVMFLIPANMRGSLWVNQVTTHMLGLAVMPPTFCEICPTY